MADSKKKTTIYDIATLANASPSAVSSVLNGTWQKRRIGKKLAQRVLEIAEKKGYARNEQASLLRRERSNIIGMIVPKYDNRYFAAIAELFESTARQRGMLPVVTCTQRIPELEFEAAKALVSYQAECIFSTGATDPDRISEFCEAAGVQSINLDLPGNRVPSVISDNYAGAKDLTHLIFDRCERDLDWVGALRFIGGRLTDHNTAARLEGFRDAHAERKIQIPEDYVMAKGYSAASAEKVLTDFQPDGPTGLFVNSTISLEGVVRWQSGLTSHAEDIRFGCFDWDPFGRFLPGNIGMVEQDVPGMLKTAFDLVGKTDLPAEKILIPCKLWVH